MRPLKYTPELINQIRGLQNAGQSTAEIAMVIGTTPPRLASRLSGLGMGRKTIGQTLKIDRNGMGTVMVPVDIIQHFIEPAKLRKLSPQELIRTILRHIAQENLLSAILDDGK